MDIYVHVLGEARRVVRSPGGGVIGNCEMQDMDRGNRTRDLCKSSKGS